MTLPPKINKIIDVGGLFVALVVDLVLNFICFSVLAPDALTRIAFIAVGIMIVLFVLRSWSKRQFAIYVVFVIVVFFFDYSFILESTRAQSNEVTAETDTELTRLSNELTTAQNTLIDLHGQYDRAVRADTLREINNQLETTQIRIDQYNADYKSRLQLIESGKHTGVRITAKNIMHAIPNAWSDKRYIEMIVFAMIFAGLQFIVASSVDNKIVIKAEHKRTPKRKRTTPTPLPEADVSRFVKWNWYRAETGMATSILPKEVFFDLVKKRNEQFSGSIYNRILAAAKRNGIIDADGKILIMDQNLAIKKIIA